MFDYFFEIYFLISLRNKNSCSRKKKLKTSLEDYGQSPKTLIKIIYIYILYKLFLYGKLYND